MDKYFDVDEEGLGKREWEERWSLGRIRWITENKVG